MLAASGGELSLVPRKAKRIKVGTRKKRLRGRAKRIGGGLWTKQIGKRRLVYEARGRKVRTVALTTRKRRSLRRYMRVVPRNVTPRPASVARTASSRIDPAKAVPEVTQRDGAQFPLYCGL